MPQLSGVARLRLSPGEVERLLKEESKRRRKLRIVQVRDAARRASKNKLEAVRKEKVKQLEKLAERIQEEWEAERQAKIEELERQYADSLKCIGNAHSQANELDLGLEQKAISSQEYRKRAEERYTTAVAKLREEKQLQEAETEAVKQARQLALAKEKLRAKEVASIPPPIRPELKNLLNKAKAACVQLTDADTYTYPYQLPADELLVERNDNSLLDGLVGAEEENAKRDDYQRESRCNNSERLEKARVRGVHALKRERMRQDYTNMMTELDLLEKADRKQRQQNLEHIPQSLYLPAHVVAEREANRQVEMERKVEDLFTDDYDNLELRANAPALNYDTTPTLTETTGESPADLPPQPPVTRVKDKACDSDRPRIPLQNVINVTSSSTTDSTSTESGSERKRKVVLKKIMKRIENQKQQWVQEEVEGEPSEGLASPTHCLPAEPTASRDLSGQETGETSNESLVQVPDTSNGESTDEQISQVRLSSESNTTTSSQFIEKQRQELVQYMASLEQQIGQLQTLKEDKEAIDEDESLTRRLEKKLANQHLLSSSTDNSASTNVFSGETLEQTQLTQSVETQTLASLPIPSPPIETVQRQAGESVWEWYLRRKATLSASIKQKLDLITSSRGDSYKDGTPPHTPSTQHNYYVQPDYGSPDEEETIPQPPGYVPVEDRQSLTHVDMSLPRQLEGAGYALHPGSGADLDQATVTSDYLSVAERERLMRPSINESANESPSYVPKEPDQLETDLMEHTQRLGRLQQLISSAKLEQFGQEQKKQQEPARFNQSGASLLHPDQSSLRAAELYQSSQRSLSGNKSTIRPSQPDQSLLRSALCNQSAVKSQHLTVESTQGDQSAISATQPDQSMPRSTLVGQPVIRSTQMDQSAVRSAHLTQSTVSTVQPEARSDHSVVPPTGAMATPSYMTVDERERLLRPSVDSLPVETGFRESSRFRPTWQEVLRSSQGSSATPQSNQVESKSDEGAQATGWSVVHHQMVARQREYNRRQEELRKQLADIQEQKRKLLAPAGDEELRNTQEQLRRTLEKLGIYVDETADEQSTPYERRERPPITTKPGVGELDLHELSVIQEVDTPTHLTSYDDNTLPDYRSIARGDSQTLTPSVSTAGSSRPHRDDELRPITDEMTDKPITSSHSAAYFNTNQNAMEVETPTLGSEDAEERKEGSLMPDAAVSVDSHRIHMLNELLQQLEARRAERQSFLEREKLTTLSDETSGGSTSADNVEHSPRILDMYSSSSADESAAAGHAGNRSIPSDNTLSAQLHNINTAWQQQPNSMPSRVSQGFSSSDSTTPSSSFLRRIYSDPMSCANDSASHSKGSSPAHDNVEQVLRTIGSDGSSGHEVTEPFVTVSLGVESSLGSATEAMSGGLSPEARSGERSVGSVQKLRREFGDSQPASGSDKDSLTQCSETSSPSNGDRELTQATDRSLALSLGQEELGGDGLLPNWLSGSDDMPPELLTTNTNEDSNSLGSAETQPSDLSTPMKTMISEETASSTPQRGHQALEEQAGLMEEPEITFASTFADSTLVDEESVEKMSHHYNSNI